MILSTLIFLPTLFALLILLTSILFKGKIAPFLSSVFSFASHLICLILALSLWWQFDPTSGGGWPQETVSWIPSLGIQYAVGLDQLSLLMIVMTAIVSILSSFSLISQVSLVSRLTEQQKSLYYALFLFLQTGLYGTFLATDLFLFYFFWEMVLIPLFIIIAFWGGEKRRSALMKFIIYTLVGSLAMLLSFIVLMAQYKGMVGVWTADMNLLKNLTLSPTHEMWLFGAISLAFLIKIPLVPFHTWQPAVYDESPMLGSIFMSAIMAKMGTYGLLRFSIGFFPHAATTFAPIMMSLGAITILYGAFACLAQTQMKRFIAYSSISHSGYIVLGLFTLKSLGQSGALYQMFNHALLMVGLFLVADFLMVRFKTQNMTEMGGVATKFPLLAVAFFIFTLSSIALPGTNSFVGEFLILLSSFQVRPLLTVVAGLGIILGAVYSLKCYQQIMFGPFKSSNPGETLILGPKQMITIIILIVLIFGIGIFPDFFFAKTKILQDTI